MYHDIRASDPIPALKAKVAQAVVDRLDGWTQVYAAHFIGTDQPRMSDLRRGRLERFSLEQLIRFATRVRGEVTVEVRWLTREPWARRPHRHVHLMG